MDFIDFIINLAPEGETALFVQQVPIMRRGVQLLHADGTPKYTWPAQLPDAARGEGKAWYANTGSFILDRMNKGVSASSANCQFVLAMMLDDIGTKSKTPLLEPTWIMETSPGSFQWGYAFSEQPTKEEYAAAITAIAAAGYTDPGATNAVRNFRIPGSVNLKEGRDRFASRLVEFHPDREFTLPQICAALGVTPEPADTGSIRAVRLADTGTDSVLEWLNEKGLVLSRPNAEGWTGIVCPNHAEHTDGQIEARYLPINRAFCCYHGHCDGLDSAAFLAWVAEHGGPKATHGLREDLLVERMRSIAAKIQPTEAFPDKAAEVIAQVERREIGRVEKAGWYERFAYVPVDDAYFDLVERCEMTRSSFNAIFRHIPCKSIHNDRRIEASVCYDENRQAMNARVLNGITYAAGDSVLVAKDGLVYGNRWRDARPDVSAIEPGDITLWLDHVALLVPDKTEREHLFDLMAFKIQNPRVKINHAVLHGGDEGCGKDTMWAPFLWAVCGPDLNNRGLIDNEGLASRWGYPLESEILLLNELKEPEASARRALANRLKPLIAAPPETIPVERKGLHPYNMINRLFVLAFTNDPVPISLPSQDRRWFCVWSRAPRMETKASDVIWDWYKAGGFGRIARWLHDRDVSAFRPAATPPLTDWKLNLVENSMSVAESFIADMAVARKGEFTAGVVGSPFYRICERLAGSAPGGVKVPQAALLHALKESRWVDLGRIGSARYTTKKHIFAAPEMVERYSKSALRDMVEELPAPNEVRINRAAE